MVNFKEIYHFLRFQRGSNCLFPIETHITCDFPGGGGGSGPPVPPSGSALVRNAARGWGSFESFKLFLSFTKRNWHLIFNLFVCLI